MDVIDHFRALCAIPHCSSDTEAMQAYLGQKATEYGYVVSTDAAGNLLCTHPEAEITLQSHYDMVCIGSAPEIVTVESEGWMRAEASTLGADNGMGMAMMLALMEEGASVDCLFTADEEVGLDGARGLELALKTPFMLNLDSEAFGEITIGCAGGVDLNVSVPLVREQQTVPCYEVVAEGYAGGHSGVDIDKNIPNAIKELASWLYAEGVAVTEFEGGERRNAIAKRAAATVTGAVPSGDSRFRPMGEQPCAVIRNDVIRMLHGFAHGVRDFDPALGIVRTSINLAQVRTTPESLEITLSARSMNAAELRRIESETRAYFEAFGATVSSEGFYAPWEPEMNDFIRTVQRAYEAEAGSDVKIGAIHAGLECGIIGEHFPRMQMASIGPTIEYPHSTRECVDLESVGALFGVVKRIVGR